MPSFDDRHLDAVHRAIAARVQRRMDVEKRLTHRYGDERERAFVDDPNGLPVPADDLMGRVIGAARGYREGPVPGLDDVADALAVVDIARRSLDGMECNLIRIARTATAERRQLTWKEIAAELGYDSPQAAQQRYQRLGGRDDTQEAGG